MKTILIIFIGLFTSVIFSLKITNAASFSIDELYEAEKRINFDSSMYTKESFTINYTADNHGYHRSVYTEVKDRSGDVVKQPVRIINILDSNNRPVRYATVMNNKDHSIDWRAWDFRRIITGTHSYKINYIIKNIVYTKLPDADYLHINIAGSSRTSDKKVRIKLIFPEGVDISKFAISSLDLKDMTTGKNLGDVKYSYHKNIAYFNYDNLPAGQRLVYYAKMPKGIFTPYRLSFWERHDYMYYNRKVFLWALPSLAVAFLCIVLWLVYGKDPKPRKTIIAEYSTLPDLKPIEVGLLLGDISLKKRYISATIMNLINRKLINLKEVLDSLGNVIDHEISISQDRKNQLDKVESEIINAVFVSDPQIKVSQLKNIDLDLKYIEKISFESLRDRGLVEPMGYNIKRFLPHISITLAAITVFVIYYVELIPFYFESEIGSIISSLLICNSIVLTIAVGFFAYIMPRLTQEGIRKVEYLKGFRWYLETVEKYPQQFHEKEVITNDVLPYTTLFGFTKEFDNKL